MTAINLATDSGGSSLRGITAGKGEFNLALFQMEPEVTPVTLESLEHCQQFKIGSTDLSRNAYVEFADQYFAIGHLAKHFKANLQLEKRKFELALPKVLALIGLISETYQVPNGAAFNLALLLPYSEYSDRDLFKQILTKALADYQFCGVKKSFVLETFICLPEGAGVLFYGREAGTSFQDLNITVSMLGYRDVSLLHINKGELSKGQSQSLGFYNFIKAVCEQTSLTDHEKLIIAICKAGHVVSPKALMPLLHNIGDSYKDYELNRIRRAILETKKQYWLMLSEWLKLQIKSDADEVIVAGGTAQYFRSELNSLLRFTKIQWCEELEKRIRATFPEQVKAHSLQYRLADVYGLFFYLYSRTNKTEL